MVQFTIARSSNTAGVAQLVEHQLAKLDVAGSNPVSRSIYIGVRSYRQGHPVVTREATGSSPVAPANGTIS